MPSFRRSIRVPSLGGPALAGKAALACALVFLSAAASAAAPEADRGAPEAPAAKAKPLPPSPRMVEFTRMQADHYAACMKKVDVDPVAAFDDADAWTTLGGGEAARHCAAAALWKQGFPADAAARLQAIAVTSPQDDAVRAGLFDQAGQAWADAKEWEKSETVHAEAIRLAPKSAGVLTDRGRSRLAALSYGPAVEDFTAALALDPKFAEARVLRAAVHRRTGALDAALADLNQAIAQSPDFLTAYLERGIVHRLMKDPARARADWMQVLWNAPEKSPAAEDARRELERMELGAP